MNEEVIHDRDGYKNVIHSDIIASSGSPAGYVISI